MLCVICGMPGQRSMLQKNTVDESGYKLVVSLLALTVWCTEFILNHDEKWPTPTQIYHAH